MAEVRSGSFNTTGYSDPGYTDHYVFSWELVSQSIVDCTSTIKWSVTGAGASNSAYWTYVQEKYVTVNGVTQTNNTKVATYNGTVAFSGQTVIKHSTSNGKGSFSASCGGAFYTYGSYNSTGSGSWDLPTIARSTTATFSSSTVALGSSVKINLAPADSSFKHKLTYSVGELYSQTSGLSSGSDFTASGTTSVTFTPPTSLGSQFPNYNSIACAVTCSTFSSNGTLIGFVTSTLKLEVPSYTPTCSVNLTGVNLLSGTYVQGRSSVSASITASSSYGATIKSYSSTLDGKIYDAFAFTSSALSAGTKTVKTTVTDSRGKTVTVNSSSITVYEYAIPYITSFTLTRQSTATTVVAAIKGGFSSVNSKNAKTVKVTLNGVTNTVSTSAYTFDTTTTFTNVPTDNTLTGQLTLTDSYNTVTKDAVLPTVAVTLDFYKDGKGVAFGKVAETTDLLDVAWSERVRKNLTVDGNTTTGGNQSVGGNLTVTGNINGVAISENNYLFGGSKDATDENWVSSYSTFLGTYNQNDQWYNTISVRHRNGHGDGTSYGLQIRNKLTQADSLTYRQNYNGGWTSWRTILDTINTADYVTEQTTSGAWTYRKWNSGYMEVYGTVSQTPTVLNNGTNSITVTLPVSFANTNFIVTITPAKCALQVSAFGDCNSASDKTHTVNSFILSYKYNYSTAYAVNFNVVIVGNWK